MTRRWVGARTVRLFWDDPPQTVLIIKKRGVRSTEESLVQVSACFPGGFLPHLVSFPCFLSFRTCRANFLTLR